LDEAQQEQMLNIFPKEIP